jgi:T5SS/PEP-CTERM-associated repeat protein
MKRLTFVGFIALSVTIAPATRAQYISDFQTNIISGVTSNWSGNYLVGSNTFADVLLIQDSGVLSNGTAYLGYEAGSSNNSVSVNGTGSIWNSGNNLYVGYSGSGNSLAISNGGQVVYSSNFAWSYIGYDALSSNNTVLVTGPGSTWKSPQAVNVGQNGSGNSLVISNGGQVINSHTFIGYLTGSSGNRAAVTGTGSVWSNSSTIRVGGYGANNSLVVSDGGKLTSVSGYLGYYSSTSSNNNVTVTGSGSVWSNYDTLSVGYLGNGSSLVISRGGKVVSGRAYPSSLSYLGSSSNSVLVTDPGSIWDCGNGLVVGSGGSGNSLVISNGGQVASGYGRVGARIVSGNSVLVTGSGSVWSNSLDLLVGYTGGVSNSLSVNNGGRVVASNIVVYSGNLISLRGGALIASNGLTISSGAILKGSGTISGNLTLESSAALQFALGGYGQGSGYDSLFVTNGVATLGGLLQLSFVNGFETNVLGADKFTLMSAKTLSGSFNNVFSGQRLTTADGAGSFLVNYSGKNLILSNFQVVPEPGTLSLCALGLVVLLCQRALRRYPYE